MWRNKKFIILAVLTILIIGVTLGGVAIAQADEEETEAAQTANVSSFLDKVAEIYQQNTGVAINADELQKAMTEAGKALKNEALDNFLKKLVASGKINQEQADAYEAWLDSRPEFPTDEFKSWWEARPDVPGLFEPGELPRVGGPFGPMHRGGAFGGKFGGMMGGKFGGWCAPGTDDIN
ncbi:MAG: hypothetical protein A2Y92_05940 [Chloroflexi bacterium RBG_13_57_8]|nr:MAG: hypothetical protein A2Y92_05940 [Chloroflexi bacterium RBG_13_57_8]